MFLMIGVHDQQKQFNFTQTILCPACGAYGRYEVCVIFSVFTLFFIPIVRWNRRYYVRSTCCGRQYELDPNVGRRIERGEQVEIKPENLRGMNQTGGNYYGYGGGTVHRCSYCGYTTTEDFEYCPKCGRHF